MHYELVDPLLKISSSHGILTCWANDVPDRIEELSLSKLEKTHKRWQHLIREVDSNIAQELLDNKQKRQEIFNILKQLGFKRYQHFTASQIKALLFYYDKGPSIVWRFHNIYPTLDLPQDPQEAQLDYSKYLPDLSPFETAQFYLLQHDKLGLIEEMPLSRIMVLMNSKNFISWVSDPKNKELLVQSEFTEYVEQNPINPEDILNIMRTGKT